MSLPDSSITTVTTAGTAVQLSNTTSRVTAIRLKAVAANSGIIYFGESDVSATNGYELSAGNTLYIPYYRDSGGTIAFSTLYVDAATSGDKLSWTAVLAG